MDNWLCLDFPRDHPATAGHFPGHPIVPGAVLLARVSRAVAEVGKHRHAPVTVQSAKFLSPVTPGDSVDLAWRRDTAGNVRFECTRHASGEKVLAGVLAFGGTSC